MTSAESHERDGQAGVLVANHAECIRAAQAERGAKLRELAQDRPAHLRYIERMLAATDQERDDMPRPRGVSGRVAYAIWEDVAWIAQPATSGLSTYPHAYRTERYRLARENEKNRQRREADRRLTELLRTS